MKIYFDMDGVIADWVAGFESYFGISYEDFSEMTKDNRDKLKSVIENDSNFFYNLPSMNGILILFSAIEAGHDVEILTSVGDENSEEVSIKKRNWLEERSLGHVPFNFTTCSEDKSLYAYPDALLIDDREKSTAPFIRAGGNAILYSCSESLIEELSNYNINL